MKEEDVSCQRRNPVGSGSPPRQARMQVPESFKTVKSPGENGFADGGRSNCVLRWELPRVDELGTQAWTQSGSSLLARHQLHELHGSLPHHCTYCCGTYRFGRLVRLCCLGA